MRLVPAALFALLWMVQPAAGEETDLIQAVRLLQAGNYPAAEKQLKGLRANARDPMEAHAAAYDLSLALFMEQDYNASMNLLQELLQRPDLLPVRLRRDVQSMLAYVMTAKAEKELSGKSGQTFAIEYVRTARQMLEEAVNSDCELQKKLGAEACRTRGYLDALERWLNSVQAEALDHFSKLFVSPNSVLEGAWKIQLFLLSARRHLKLFEDVRKEQPDLTEAYLKTYLIQLNEIRPLFSKTAELSESSDKEQVQQMNDSLGALMDALSDHEWEKASSAFANLTALYDRWMSSILNDSSTAQLLIHARSWYEESMRGPKLHPASLEAVLSNFNRIPEEKLSIPLAAAKEQTAQALEALELGKNREARAWIESAKFILTQAVLRTQIKGHPTPAFILQAGIVAQRQAAQITRLWIGRFQEIPPPIARVLSQVQQQVLENMKPFLSSVYELQGVNYRGTEKKKGVCQHRPWDAILPTFHKGWEAAAGKFGEKWGVLLQNQEEAISSWEQAAQLLALPFPEEQAGCYNKPPDDQGGGGGAEGENGSAPKNIPDVLRQLQLMEMDDKLEKKHNVIRKEGKPW